MQRYPPVAPKTKDKEPNKDMPRASVEPKYYAAGGRIEDAMIAHIDNQRLHTELCGTHDTHVCPLCFPEDIDREVSLAVWRSVRKIAA